MNFEPTGHNQEPVYGFARPTGSGSFERSEPSSNFKQDFADFYRLIEQKAVDQSLFLHFELLENKFTILYGQAIGNENQALIFVLQRLDATLQREYNRALTFAVAGWPFPNEDSIELIRFEIVEFAKEVSRAC
jgi:hypothetical protein